MDKIHKFEQAGLGLAPYKVTGWDREVYKASPDAPIQPGGTCDYCGQGIMYVFNIESSDGKRFDVGSDCVLKSGEAGIVNMWFVKDEVKIHKAEMRRAKDRTTIAQGNILLRENRDMLATTPHPHGFENKTLADYADWMFKTAGITGQVKTAKLIKNIIEKKYLFISLYCLQIKTNDV